MTPKRTIKEKTPSELNKSDGVFGLRSGGLVIGDW